MAGVFFMLGAATVSLPGVQAKPAVQLTASRSVWQITSSESVWQLTSPQDTTQLNGGGGPLQ